MKQGTAKHLLQAPATLPCENESSPFTAKTPSCNAGSTQLHVTTSIPVPPSLSLLARGPPGETDVPSCNPGHSTNRGDELLAPPRMQVAILCAPGTSTSSHLHEHPQGQSHHAPNTAPPTISYEQQSPPVTESPKHGCHRVALGRAMVPRKLVDGASVELVRGM